MNSEALKDALRVKLFRWSLAEWDREHASGFEKLRSIKSVSATKIVGLMGTLAPEEQRRLARALVKRFHPEAVRLTGETLEDAEAESLRQANVWRQHAAPALEGRGPLSRDERRTIAKLVKEELSFLGTPKAFGSSAEWRYLSTLGAWYVVTHLDIGGSFGEINYHHEIGLEGERPFIRFLSLLSWLGVSSETRLKVADLSEARQAAQVIGSLARHFLDAMGEMTRDVEMTASC